MANNDYITTDCKLTVSKNTAKLDEEIFLYKNDRNIKLLIEIVDNKYRYKSDDLSNLLVKYKASYAQVKWYKNAEVKKEFPIQATDDGKVVFVIEGQLIDEDTELGDYDLQLRLLNESQESIRSLPIIKGAVHILKPLFEEGDIATVNSAVADVSMLSLDGDAIDTYNSDGTYNQTNWGNGDVISSAKLNKLEKVAKDNVDKVNKMPAKSIVEGGKIYLAKEDGTKLDSGTELPAGGSTIEVVNNLESDSTTAALSAAQGKALNTQYKDIAKAFKNNFSEETLLISNDTTTITNANIQYLVVSKNTTINIPMDSLLNKSIKLNITCGINDVIITFSQDTNILKIKLKAKSFNIFTLNIVKGKTIIQRVSSEYPKITDEDNSNGVIVDSPNNGIGNNITLNDYQTKVDNNLATTSKEIVGSINEINKNINAKEKCLINNDSKLLLIKILRNGTYQNDQSSNINDLASQLQTEYNVTNNLANSNTSNNNSTILANTSYIATINADFGYIIKSITVKMGEVDITSSSVSEHTITVNTVTDNLIITCTTALDETVTHKNKWNPNEQQVGLIEGNKLLTGGTYDGFMSSGIIDVTGQDNIIISAYIGNNRIASPSSTVRGFTSTDGGTTWNQTITSGVSYPGNTNLINVSNIDSIRFSIDFRSSSSSIKNIVDTIKIQAEFGTECTEYQVYV